MWNRLHFIEYAWEYGTEQMLEAAYLEAVRTVERWHKMFHHAEKHIKAKPMLSRTIDFVVALLIGLPLGCWVAFRATGTTIADILPIIHMILGGI